MSAAAVHTSDAARLTAPFPSRELEYGIGLCMMETTGGQTARTSSRQPDALTLGGFLVVVFLGGANFVAVKYSNEGFPPFFGAAIRFLAASLLLFAWMRFRKIPPPRKGEWTGTALFGLFGIAAFYAFGYWGLLWLPTGVAAVIAASVPLLTLLLAHVQKVERITVRGLVGSGVAIGGIGTMVGLGAGAALSVAAILAVLAAALSDAEAAIIIKQLPTGHPVATNAFAMSIGSLSLFALSLAWKEPWSISMNGATSLALAYLVLLGSIALFVLYLWTLKRWTASGMSYMFVLMPLVAAVLGTVLRGEGLAAGEMIGGAIILAGVYIGALSRPSRSPS